ncbi:MAG: RtcB family protein [Anaerolineales bacterium]|nr:RtcB family protein [Anaerolineales bacterium]
MVNKQDFKRIEEYVYEIPKSFRPDMRVPARLYADEELLEAALKDRSMEQLINTATLPGVVKYTLAMPDIHQGYGPPIGGVIPLRTSDGVISPGAVGYDINCGIRLLRSNFLAEKVKPIMDEIVDALFRGVPSGVGRSGDVKLSHRDTDDVLERGSAWAVSQGYGTKDDLEHTEERGGMAGAEARAVSPKAKKRGQDQLGTLGSGNHFVEVAEVEEVYDQEVADAFGLFPGQMVVWVHSGSRGLGHQVCTDYVRDLQSAVTKYGIKLPDRELVCAPFDSPEGRDYFAAMASAANYAWANRQVLAHRVRQILDDVLAGLVKDRQLTLVYDVAHNIAKVEEYPIDGQLTKLVIHRKGATRAFGPGMKDLPADYREVGQPVLIPGDMGTASYVLVGTTEAMEKTFGTSCHGAGRVMSRSAAKKKIRGQELRQELAEKGIVVRGGSMAGLAEEAPEAYKDVDRVVNVVHSTGIARKVARVVPLGVIKG